MLITRRLSSRSIGEWTVMLKAAAILVATNVALRLCNFQAIRRLLIRCARRVRPIGKPVDAEKIVRAVERISRPLRARSTCLSIALTAEALLTHYGHDSVLCLGAKRASGQFTAHAWVEQNDAVLIGGPREVTLEYARFPSIPV
jgi:hypothetical protein